jgi:hypothetical protein
LRINPCCLRKSAFSNFNFLSFTRIGTHRIVYHNLAIPLTKSRSSPSKPWAQISSLQL